MPNTTRDNEFSKIIAAELRAIIAKSQISKQKISEDTGIPARTLARYLNEAPPLTIDAANKIAESIGISLNALLTAAQDQLT